jgi:hypothetical protein
MRTNEREQMTLIRFACYQLLFVTTQLLLSADKFVRTFAAAVAKLIVIQ